MLGFVFKSCFQKNSSDSKYCSELVLHFQKIFLVWKWPYCCIGKALIHQIHELNSSSYCLPQARCAKGLLQSIWCGNDLACYLAEHSWNGEFEAQWQHVALQSKEGRQASLPCFPWAAAAEPAASPSHLRPPLSAPGSRWASGGSCWAVQWALSPLGYSCASAEMLRNWDTSGFYHYCVSLSPRHQAMSELLSRLSGLPRLVSVQPPGTATAASRLPWMSQGLLAFPWFLHFDFGSGAALFRKCPHLNVSDGPSWWLKSVLQSCVCAAFPCWASTLPEGNNRCLISYFIYFLFFFLFFSYFFREKLKAINAIKGVAHFMGFTIGALKTFLFSRKTFCKNQHVNKKPLQPRRPRRYFLAAVSLASRWERAESASSSSATAPWG